MKKYTGGCMALLLIGGIVLAPGTHAANEQALRDWSEGVLQSIESSGAGALQQMTRDAVKLQQPQLKIRVRLSDDSPADLKEQLTGAATDEVTDTDLLPQSKIQRMEDKLSLL